MISRYLFLLAISLILLTTACGLAAGGVRAGEPPAAPATAAATLVDCPVTEPAEPAFVPPAPWPARPPDAHQFWFGDAGLWTALPVDGSWRQLVLGEKFWWWSERFDAAGEPAPDLTVTARRLDGAAPELQLTGATNGYHESFHWAMLIGVTVPAPGCWQFTGQYGGDQLSFVLWVPPE